MDRDGSGTIIRAELDCEEFRSVVRSVLAPQGGVGMGGAQYARAEMNMNQAINFCLRKADLNDDNCITFDEFKAFMLCLRQEDLAKHTANLIFALFDLDQDHLISESEFLEVCRFYLGYRPTELEFQKEWGRLDRAGRGKVTRSEYIQWLRASANPIFRQHAPPVDPEFDSAEWSDQVVSSASSDRSLPLLRKSGSVARPLWNQRLASANPNLHCPVSRKRYFARPQSLPELSRHYEAHRGFQRHKERLREPEPTKKVPVLSTDTGEEFLVERALPGGQMRNRSTGRPQQWEDHWQTPKCMKPHCRPGSLLLRTEPPPSG